MTICNPFGSQYKVCGGEAFQQNRATTLAHLNLPTAFSRSLLNFFVFFQIIILYLPYSLHFHHVSFGTTRLLLDVSWNDLRRTICNVHSIGPDCTRLVLELFSFMKHPSCPGESFRWPLVSRDLARRMICIIKDVYFGKLPREILRCILKIPGAWSCQVRASPPCPELLHDLEDFQPLSQLQHEPFLVYDIFNVLNWLKSFSDPPLEMIAQWTQYMFDSQMQGHTFDQSTYESGWTWTFWQEWVNKKNFDLY